MMEITGFILAFIIGIVMGLVGAGGSILTSGILVYIFSINPVLSASYTLLNVGVISMVGCARYYKKDLVDVKTGLLFSIPALIMVFCMRRFVMPAIPHDIFIYHDFVFTKDLLILLIFAVLMIIISWSMIRRKDVPFQSRGGNKRPVAVILPGIMVGLLTGFVGVGGGFIIVPALIFFTGLEVKKAVGTSLFIITLNTAIGFMGDYTSGVCYNWVFLLKLISVTVAGMICSSQLTGKISNEALKKVFGYTILVLGCGIIVKELLLK